MGPYLVKYEIPVPHRTADGGLDENKDCFVWIGGCGCWAFGKEAEKILAGWLVVALSDGRVKSIWLEQLMQAWLSSVWKVQVPLGASRFM